MAENITGTGKLLKGSQEIALVQYDLYINAESKRIDGTVEPIPLSVRKEFSSLEKLTLVLQDGKKVDCYLTNIQALPSVIGTINGTGIIY